MTDMPVTTTPLQLELWLAELVISALFASGFVVYYRQLWSMAQTDSARQTQRARWLNVAMIAITTILGLSLQSVATILGADAVGMVFDNLGLFILAFPLLDEGSSLVAYIVRAAALLWMWTLHYWTAIGDWNVYVSLILLLVLLVGLRLFADKIRYNVWRHTLAFSLLAAVFWIFAPYRIGQMTTSPLLIAQALVTFVVMALVTVLYLRYDNNLRLKNAAIAQEAHYDALTNSKNYAAYKEDVTGIFTRAKAEKRPVAMAVLDIDHFKQINDHYGHLAGDEVLAGVANTLTKLLARYPGVHTLYRTGGEEFNVVFPDCGVADVQNMLLECWRVVRETRFTAANYEVLVTISIGLAELQPDDQKFDDLYARADASLYQSKHYGRDVVTVMGKTIGAARKPRTIMTSAIFNQKIVNVRHEPYRVVHNEVRLARYDSDRDEWLFPREFELAVPEQLEFIRRAIPNTEVKKVMINITLEQFAEPSVLQQLVDFKHECTDLQVLVVELMGVPDTDLMRWMGPQYRAHDLRLEFDDMDVDWPLADLRPQLLYLDGVKFELADLRAAYPDSTALVARLDAWHRLADPLAIDIVITGIENSVDAKYAVDELHAHYLQGYFYDRPALPRMG
ncbi:GGDEF domain-containing protein [Lacticaseibacillus sharpeae]|uniref:GGDEF domain-containing protein n=1 Tax=Lacticaseibacillus sharpeae TaxID=1626 RepID=UPI0006D259F6|nr:diguanylate cyclase [Lacticaseibacillus sharpeae]